MRVRARDKLRAQASREAPHAEASAALVQLIYTGTTQPWHRWERAVKSRSCYRVSCVHVYALASRTLPPLLNQSPPCMWVRALFFFLFFYGAPCVCRRFIRMQGRPLFGRSPIFLYRDLKRKYIDRTRNSSKSESSSESSLKFSFTRTA